MGDGGMTRLYLIRHAEAEGNLYRLAHGHYDSLITERGYRQIAALRRRFADIPVDAVYASDLFRTRTTARAIYESKGLPLHTDPALREIGVGVWENRPWQELGMKFPELMVAFNHDMGKWHVEGSETAADVLSRFIPALERIARENDGKTVAVFSHGTALRLVLGTLQGMSLEEINETRHADNTAVSLLEYENGAFRVVFRDDNSHLMEAGLSTLAQQSWWKNKNAREQGAYYGEMTDADRKALAEQGVTVPAEGRVIAVYCEGTVIGGVQLLPEGVIGWYYLLPDYRGRRLGVPPLGQAVKYYRPRGIDRLRLRCADGELRPFFAKLGFVPTEDDWMEKYIGYEERAEI